MSTVEVKKSTLTIGYECHSIPYRAVSALTALAMARAASLPCNV
jgi:hypothetical protein